MLNNLKTRNKESGFTIIEVLIVLAIAGLILLIVFLAVPALQRNARNTTLKADASATAAAVSDYSGQYNGAVPKYIGGTAGAYTMQDTSAGGQKTSFKTNGSTSVYGFAPAANATAGVTPVYTPGSTGTASNKIDYGQVVVEFGQDCAATLNNRATAVYYVPEGGQAVQCVQS